MIQQQKKWVYNEKKLREELKDIKKTKRPLYRWSETEEKYLLEFLPKIGLKGVSKNLRRSPEAVFSKLLRLVKVIGSDGRMLVSCRSGEENNAGSLKSQVMLVQQARSELCKIKRNVSAKKSKTLLTSNNCEAVAKENEVTIKENRAVMKENNTKTGVKNIEVSVNIVIIACILFLSAILSSAFLFIKFIL